jgi:hypothetical protein
MYLQDAPAKGVPQCYFLTCKVVGVQITAPHIEIGYQGTSLTRSVLGGATGLNAAR